MRINHTMKDSIFNILVDRISGGFYDEGEQLVELDLAEEFDVSRSPVREAIRQLVAYDLAISIPHKGIFVKKLDNKKMKEIFELRILLENYCISKIDLLISEKFIEELKRIRKEINDTNIDIKSYTDVDEKLHNLLIDFGQNDTISEIYHRNISLVRTFRSASLIDETRYKESIDEHLVIIDSIIEGDYEKACIANERHLSKALDTILENS